MTMLRDGWAYIYGVPPANLRFEESIKFLEALGISLFNPATSDARWIVEGKQIPTTKQDIVRRLDLGLETPFVLWLAESTSETGGQTERFRISGSQLEIERRLGPAVERGEWQTLNERI